MYIYLVRHAHTQQEKETASKRWRLSEDGRLQAEALGQEPFWANVDQIVVSSEAKTRLSIQPALATWDIPVAQEARFDELRRGGWIEDYVAHVRQIFASPEHSIEESESAADALERFVAGICALQEIHSGRTMAVIGHGLIFSLYRAHLLGKPTVDFDDWQSLPFASVALVDPVQRLLLEDFRRLQRPY